MSRRSIACLFRVAMQTQAAAATLALTVELETGAGHPAAPADVDAARGRLLKAIRTEGLSATWAVADPAISASTQDLLQSIPRQEVAVLGDRTWMGVGAGSERQNRELTRRFERSRAQGVRVQSLVIQALDGRLDLQPLIDHQISAVRLPAVENLATVAKPAPAGQDAIYVAPTAWKLPEIRNWWQEWNVLWQVSRQLITGEFHLAIHVGTLASASRRTWQTLERIVVLAGQKQRGGSLRVVTLAQLAEEHFRRQQTHSQRSILRAA